MALLRPVFLVENLASVVHFGAHVVSGNEEPTGTEAFRFATGRRGDHWSPSAFNADAWLKIVFDRVRSFDFLLLWDHNLSGKTLRWQASDDDYATPPQTLFDEVLPSVTATGHVDDTFGVRTEDGKWLKRIPVRSAKSTRLFIPAMGANQKPSINGIVGLSYSPNQYDLPFDDSSTMALVEEERSEVGVLGRGTRVAPRHGRIVTKMRGEAEYELARYHLERRFVEQFSPMLIVHDEAQADRAALGVHQAGESFGFTVDGSLPYGEDPHRKGEFGWVENDVKELT